jgi:hypothetical protein
MQIPQDQKELGGSDDRLRMGEYDNIELPKLRGAWGKFGVDISIEAGSRYRWCDLLAGNRD